MADEAYGEGDPDAPEGADLVWALVQARRPLDALELLGSLLAADPSNPELIALEAVVLLALDDHEGAAQRAQDAVSADPDIATADLVTATVHFQAGQVADAIRVLEPAVTAHPDDLTLSCLLARAYAAAGRDDDAHAAAGAALRAAGDHPYVLGTAGIVELAAGSADRAEVWFRAALTFADGEETATWGSWLADALRRQYRYREATDVLVAIAPAPSRADPNPLGTASQHAVYAGFGRPVIAALVFICAGAVTDSQIVALPGYVLLAAVAVTAAIRYRRLNPDLAEAFRTVELIRDRADPRLRDPVDRRRRRLLVIYFTVMGIVCAAGVAYQLWWESQR